MTDYPLARARSLAVMSSSPTLLARTYSVPDIGQYYRYSDTYTPSYRSIYSYTPYRYRRDYGLYDDYWYNRYSYYPRCSSTLYPSFRYSYTGYPYSSYWSSYSDYWTRYKRYSYDYENPSLYYRPYYYSAYDRYLSSTYNPYRSYLLGY